MDAVQVLLDVTARAVTEPLDYSVPDSIASRLRVGCPVLVPFGNRPATGYVVSTASSSYASELKDVIDVLDEPLFDEDDWSFARWIAGVYACRPVEALKLFMPPGSTPRMVKEGSGWRLMPRAVKPSNERIVELCDHGYQPPASAHRQRSVLAALTSGPVSVAELTAEIGDVTAAIAALERRGVVAVSTRRRWRSVGEGLLREEKVHFLNRDQQRAVEAIRSAAPGSVILLHGVTGSGKTDVYIHAVREVVSCGKSAIVLVPEISLTPQTVGRFRARFGAQLAVLHSRLSDGERLDQWQLAAHGAARVVIGARSALFAPVSDLGLIVIDEEHEPSYKQGSAPRYHARTVAEELARRTGAVVVLGSATPSIESVVRVAQGAWSSVELPLRATRAPFPPVTVVDMAQEFATGNRSIFSLMLAEALQQTIDRSAKAVLFINRRGFSSFMLCRECGYVPRCPHCSVSLTYHERAPSLRCHHCGHAAAVPMLCPRCGSPYLRRFGAGTERVQAEAKARWPDVPVVRMDADTTAGKGGHERVLRSFEEMSTGILVGTQMIAKGLDYPDIELVGVIDADTSMHFPDFRATERTYQLLMQVAGRAGRSGRPGRVVVQTYWPDHPAITALVSGDAEELVRSECGIRSTLGYPPFGALARILLSGGDRQRVMSAASETARHIRESAPETWSVMGPVEPPLARLKGRHRVHILVKAPAGTEVGPVLWVAAAAAKARDVAIAIDVDPYDLL